MSKTEQVKTKGWANCIAWNPNGKSLTVAVHNSTVIRVDFDNQMSLTKKFLSVYRHLPFLQLYYSDENTLVATGYDSVPLILKNEENRW